MNNSEFDLPAFWRKLEIFTKFLASVLIPVTIALVGQSYSSALKEKEIELRYIEIATSILQQKPSRETSEIREWAIDILSTHSPVPLSERTKDSLKKGQIKLYTDYLENSLDKMEVNEITNLR